MSFPIRQQRHEFNKLTEKGFQVLNLIQQLVWHTL